MKTLIAFLMLAAVASAGDYSYSGGYYWSGGVAHQRLQSNYWDGYCWRCRYNYRPVEFQVAYREKLVQAYSEPIEANAFAAEVIKLKAKYDYDLEQKRIDAETIRKTLEAVGLKAPLASTAAYTAPGGVQQVTSGTTVYGYPSVTNVASLYSDGVNLDTKLQQAQRTVDNLAKLVGDANEGNLQAIKEVASGRDRTALVLAAAQLVSASPGIQTTTTASAQSQPVVNVMAAANLDQILTARCAKCHSGDTPKGKNDLFPQGVNLSQWTKFTDEQWKVTVAAVAEGTMPPGGNPIPLSEAREFFNARELK